MSSINQSMRNCPTLLNLSVPSCGHSHPLKVWSHHFMGITSIMCLHYSQVNLIKMLLLYPFHSTQKDPLLSSGPSLTLALRTPTAAYLACPPLL